MNPGKHVVSQALVFLLIAVLALGFGVRYVVAGGKLGPSYALHVRTDQAQSVAEGIRVTYRGRDIGTVTDAQVADDGRGVDLRLDIRSGADIPRGSIARTVTSTALGDQYIDIRPSTAAGPYLQPGDEIEMPAEAQPPAVEELVGQVYESISALDPQSVEVLGQATAEALDGRSGDLVALIDNADRLSAVVADRAPTLRGLVDDSMPVVETLAAREEPISTSIGAVRDVSTELAREEDALVFLLERGPGALQRSQELLDANREDAAGILANAVTITPILAARSPAFREGLVQGPRGLEALVGTVRNGRADFTLVATQGPVCVYPSTPRRGLGDESPREPDLSLYCPPGPDLAQRGSRTAPRPDDLGLGNATTPGEVAGPTMADNPLIVPTGEEIVQYWSTMLEGMNHGR